jgi:hypothetical protein
VGLAKHSHIAARGYVKAWAEDVLVGVGWVNYHGPDRLPPAEIAVRSGFYLDQDADGSANDWFEQQMGKVEGAALRVIREIEDRWPIEGEARAKLAEFLGLQYLRTPAYRDWYAGASVNVRELRPDRNDEVIQMAEDHLATARQRHLLMARQLPCVGTVFANMHWALLRCGSPRLATGDQPLVPQVRGHRQPVAAISSSGVMGIAEVRFALSPTLLLLMTWADDYSPEPVLKLPHHLVRNHNALVMTIAEEQWFHVPSRPIRHGARGMWCNIGGELPYLRGRPALDTHRFRVVSQVSNEVLETEGPERDGIRTIDWPTVRAKLQPNRAA